MNDASVQHAVQLFKQHLPDFVDFDHPGTAFEENENRYKRDILASWQAENGPSRLRELAEAGEGVEAWRFLRRTSLLSTPRNNLLGRYGFDQELLKDDAKLSALFRHAAEVSENHRGDPERTIEEFHARCDKDAIPIAWSLFFYLLWLYRPEQFFPIKISVIRETAKKLGAEIREGSLSPEGAKDVFRFVDTVRERIADLKPRDNLDAQGFLWTCHHLLTDGSSAGQVNSRRYWAAGTTWGEDQMVEEFVEKNEWRAGFDTETAPESSDGRLFLENYPRVQVGDFVAMKGWGGRNDLRVYYVGEVVDKDEERFAIALKPLAEVPHFRSKAPRKGGKGGWGTTLAEVVSTEAIEQIFGVTPMSRNPDAEQHLPSDLNLILYGPPGTGKTYSTVRKAVGLIDRGSVDDRANRRFQELKRAGRIEFLTFHQSYSYEDFVEGIRPDVDDDGDGEAKFKLKDGVFKRMAIKAAYHCLEEITEKPSANFSDAWEGLCREIRSNPSKVFEVAGMTQKFTMSVSSVGHIAATDHESKAEMTCNKEKARSVFAASKSQGLVSVEEAATNADDATNGPLIAFVVNLLKAKASGHREGPTFSQLWEKLLEMIDEDETFRLQLKTQKYVPKITARGNIEAYTEDNPNRIAAHCGMSPAQEVFTKLRNMQEVNSGDVHRAMGRGANWHLIAAVINELKKLEASWKDEDAATTSESAKEVTFEEMKTSVLEFLKEGERARYRLKGVSLSLNLGFPNN